MKVPTIKWDVNEAIALRSLLRDESHRKAVELIMFKACGIRDLCMHLEGDGGPLMTAFDLGRRAVGLSIAQLLEEAISERIAAVQKTSEANQDG